MAKEEEIIDKITNYLDKVKKLTPESSYLLLTKVRNQYWDLIDQGEEPEEDIEDEQDWDDDEEMEEKKPLIKKPKIKLRK